LLELHGDPVGTPAPPVGGVSIAGGAHGRTERTVGSRFHRTIIVAATVAVSAGAAVAAYASAESPDLRRRLDSLEQLLRFIEQTLGQTPPGPT
jgi:hypothetical protein